MLLKKKRESMKHIRIYSLIVTVFFLGASPYDVKKNIIERVNAIDQFKKQQVEKNKKILAHELVKLEQKLNPTCLWNRLRRVQPKTEKLIYIIVLGNNNHDNNNNNNYGYKKNLDSIMTQDYSNFHVLYVLDSSRNSSHDTITQYVQEKKWADKITFIYNPHNTRHVYNLENIYNVIQNLPDHAIVTYCDSSDWYDNQNFLTLINKIYDDKNIWVTYGSFVNWPTRKIELCKKIPKTIVAKRSFRTYRSIVGKPQTFYAWLFKLIKKEDLTYKNDFFKACEERAIINPLLEMAGHRLQFIPDTLYVYNNEARRKNITKTQDLEKFYSNIIIQQKKYDFLKEPKITIN